MAGDTRTVKATCLCGAAKHEITLPTSAYPLKAYLCHCNSCRHSTGTLCLTEANLPPSYSPAEELLEKLSPYDFSKRLTNFSCSTCGSKLLCRAWVDSADHSKGATWDVMCGTLEQADGVYDYQAHEHIQDTLDGGFADFLPDLPRWPGTPGKHELHPSKEQALPLDWTSSDHPQSRPSATDRLHCHCKCDGVEFWIARPSERSKNASCAWPDAILPDYLNQQGVGDTQWWLMDDGSKFCGGVCACNSCRLDSGQEWVEWAFVPTIDISLDAEGNKPWDLPYGSLKGWGTLKGYESSKGGKDSSSVVRYHCATCGASVFFTTDSRKGLVDVAVGLLDAAEGARAESWLEFWTRRLSFREDSISRAEANTLALEAGLRQFGERHNLAAKQAEIEKTTGHEY